MIFKFEVNLTEEDYIDFNKFHMTKSYYGKKQIKTIRKFIVFLFLISAVLLLLIGGLNTETLFSLIPLPFLFVFFYFGFVSFSAYGVKFAVKNLKKSGKLPYSENSILEFSDESISELTDTTKTEHKYTSVERVSVICGKIIYIHVNTTIAYLLPISCFDSAEHYGEFMDFIKTKCENIEFY